MTIGKEEILRMNAPRQVEDETWFRVLRPLLVSIAWTAAMAYLAAIRLAKAFRIVGEALTSAARVVWGVVFTAYAHVMFSVRDTIRRVVGGRVCINGKWRHCWYRPNSLRRNMKAEEKLKRMLK